MAELFFVTLLVALEMLSLSPSGPRSVVAVDDACVSFSGEGGRVVARDLPGPSAGLEALTCWWARAEREKEKKNSILGTRKAKVYKR